MTSLNKFFIGFITSFKTESLPKRIYQLIPSKKIWDPEFNTQTIHRNCGQGCWKDTHDLREPGLWGRCLISERKEVCSHENALFPLLMRSVRLKSPWSTCCEISRRDPMRAATLSLISSSFWRSDPTVILNFSRSPAFSMRPPSWMRVLVRAFRTLWELDGLLLSIRYFLWFQRLRASLILLRLLCTFWRSLLAKVTGFFEPSLLLFLRWRSPCFS